MNEKLKIYIDKWWIGLLGFIVFNFIGLIIFSFQTGVNKDDDFIFAFGFSFILLALISLIWGIISIVFQIVNKRWITVFYALISLVFSVVFIGISMMIYVWTGFDFF